MTDFIFDVEQCLEVLHYGGVILYPTDTVWGLGCDATNEQAVEKIYRLKQRPGDKSIIMLMTDEKEVLRYITQPDLRVFDYLKTVTKPTTVIYEGAIGVASNVIAGDGTVGIRIVHDPFCRRLVKRFRKPVVSTSANLSGHPAPQTFTDIAAEVKAAVDYVVQYRQDDKQTAAPSGIIKWNKDGSVTVIR